MKKSKEKPLYSLGRFICYLLSTLCFEQTVAQSSEFADPTLTIQKNIELASIEKDVQPIKLFQSSPETEKLKSENDAVVSEAMYFDLNKEKLISLIEKRPFSMRLQVTNSNGEEIIVDLVRYTIYSDGYKTGSISNGNYAETDYQEGVHYRGMISGNPESIAAISLFDNGVQGVITNKEGNWVLGQLKNKEEYILYNDKNLKTAFQLNCGTQDVGSLNPELGANTKSFCPLNVFWVGDYDFFGVSNYNMNNALNNISAIFNNVAALYQQEGVVVFLSEVYIHTTPDNYSETDSWNAFHSFGYQIHQAPNFNEDLAMLLAVNLNGNGSSYGIIDALCADFVPQQNGRYAYSRIDTYAYNVPTFSNTIQVVTHEMGHNVGSRHTHWCGWPGGAIDNCANTEADNFGNYCNPGPYPADGGTIMSYCATVYGSINFLNGFGYYPHQEIIGDITNASGNCLCLGIKQNEENSFVDVFPNPGYELITVETNYSFSQYQIVNCLGQIVASGDYVNEIDISFLAEGVYNLVIWNEDLITSKQIVKSR